MEFYGMIIHVVVNYCKVVCIPGKTSENEKFGKKIKLPYQWGSCKFVRFETGS